MDLTKFLLLDHPSESCKQIHSRDGKRYATNGHIMVVVDGTEGAGIGAKTDNVINVFNAHSAICEGEFYLIPEIKIQSIPCGSCKATGKALDCPCCEGEGDIESEHFYTDHAGKSRSVTIGSECPICEGCGENKSDGNGKCEDCNGTGSVTKYESESIKIGSQYFGLEILELARELPNVMIQNSRSILGGALLTFDGGQGIIMPRHPPTDR